MNQSVIVCIIRTRDAVSHKYCIAAFVESELKIYCFCHELDINPDDVVYLDMVREISADVIDIVTEDMTEADIANVMRGKSRHVRPETYDSIWSEFKHRDDVSIEMVIH